VAALTPYRRHGPGDATVMPTRLASIHRPLTFRWDGKEADSVDWIEELVGISPDGGNGLTEGLIFLSLAIALAAAIVWRLRRYRA
jgi:hypothetical protein